MLRVFAQSVDLRLNASSFCSDVRLKAECFEFSRRMQIVTGGLQEAPRCARQHSTEKWKMIMQKSKAFFLSDFSFCNFASFVREACLSFGIEAHTQGKTLHIFATRLDLRQNASRFCAEVGFKAKRFTFLRRG